MRQTEIQSIVYQIIVDGVPGDIRHSFHATMKRIGYLLAQDPNELQRWQELSEFKGQDSAELSGSFYHRIRYAMLDDKRDFKVSEHVICEDPSRPSPRKTIDIRNEFDPDFEIQTGLNQVAQGIETEMQAGAKLEAIIRDHVCYSRISSSDEEIIEALQHTSDRMTSGNSKIAFHHVTDPKTFLDKLPSIARKRFDELLAEMTTSPTHKLG